MPFLRGKCVRSGLGLGNFGGRAQCLKSFFHAAGRGRVFRESSNPRLRNNTGVLLPFGHRVRELVDAVSFNNILEGCPLYMSNAYLAYRRSAEVD